MQRAGYETLEEGFDTFCLRTDIDDALTELWRGAEPAVPGVAKSDEGAGGLEFTGDRSRWGGPAARRGPRESCATTTRGWPSCARRTRRWTSRRRRRRAGAPSVSPAFLDLRWFRGESLITWHYRRAPEETELPLPRVAASTLRTRDRLGLLRPGRGGRAVRVLDGSRFPGAPRVSRDLLDSVNELSFLARAGFAEPDGLRVLEVGAGYGRLAHRAARRLPNLADWCCVDGRARGDVPIGLLPALPWRACRRRAWSGCTRSRRLRPGDFDLAVNVHAFPEMPLAAARWWIERLAHAAGARVVRGAQRARGRSPAWSPTARGATSRR